MRKRSLWSLTFVIALLTMTLGAAFAATDPLIPPGVPTPDPNQPFCVDWAVPSTETPSPAVQKVMDQLTAETGKPTVVTRIAAERCFNTRAEFDQFTQSGEAAYPPGLSGPTTTLDNSF